MKTVYRTTAAIPDPDWQIEFKHAGIWYPIGAHVPDFSDAWAALKLLAKGDSDQPVERRIVKFFN